MSDTPRTDAQVRLMLSPLQSGTEEVVLAELARELERENAKLRDKIAGLEAACDSLQQTVHALQNP